MNEKRNKKERKEKREREREGTANDPCSLFFGCDRTGAGLRDQARNAEILQQYLGRVVELFIGESLFDPRLSTGSADNRIGFNSSGGGERGEDVMPPRSL